jgi:ornithine decarboxylase
MKRAELENLEKIARKNGVHHIDGNSVLVIDHDEIRKNYRRFTEALPRVQAYFAVKANSLPEIVETIFKMGGSFDVASYPEFLLVHRLIKDWSAKERQDFIWEKIIYAHPVKKEGTLRKLNKYKPLVTYDNLAEVGKIQQYAPNAGLVLRLWSPNTGSNVELSNKFGADKSQAVDLIAAAIDAGLGVEGLSFHVGSQCNNFSNYVQALEFSSRVFEEAEARKYDIGHNGHGERKRVIDIGGGFPVRYHHRDKKFERLAELLNSELDRLFPKRDFEVIAEPGRFMVATAATLVSSVIGKAQKNNKTCYYIDDGVYHTFSGQIFDHIYYTIKAFKKGHTEICTIFGRTCDGFDVISQNTSLPPLELRDLVYAENIGAYSNASSTHFNGFPPAKIVHINK